MSLSLGACSDGGGGGGTSGQHVDTTRSAACLQFEDALCDWNSDKCSASGSRAACDESSTAIYCKSDETAQACTKALATASCDALPTECMGIGDSARALGNCKQLVAGVCAIGDRCDALDGQSLGDCQTEGEARICVGVVGAKPTINTCLDDLRAESCPGVGQKLVLPTSCNAVIKQSSTSTASVTPGGRWQSLAGAAPGGLTEQ